MRAVTGSEEDSSEIGKIVEDCIAHLLDISFISFCHIFREANGVAHRVAHLASSHLENFSWVEEASVIIHDVLFENRCNSFQGQGTLSTPESLSPFINTT